MEEKMLLKGESTFQQAKKKFFRHKLAMFGLAVLSLLVIMTLVIPLFNKNLAFDLNFLEINQKPSLKHFLGTDSVGRDTFMRIMLGGRVSLLVGFVSVAFATIIGVVFGGLAGYFGGKIDMIIMRFTDTIMCFPFLIIAMVLVAILGPSLRNTMIVIAILDWPNTARITRGEILKIRQQQFIEADVCLGIRTAKIIFQQIIPNAFSPIIVNATFNMANAIMTEASLSFLGLGVPLPQPTWGNMLKEASSLTILKGMPWLWLSPGFMIALTVLSINFIGDGLRDALDPTMGR